jgi:hypothetical protein
MRQQFGMSPTGVAGAPMSDRVAAVTTARSPSIEANTFAWSWRRKPVPVGYEVSGPAGAEPILMLPAMSTVSTRDELRAVAHHLETRRCVITDWPGFGDTARPRLDYDRALCRGFLEELVAHLQSELKRPRSRRLPAAMRPATRSISRRGTLGPSRTSS